MTRKAPREEVALEAEDRERREHEARDTDDGPEHGVNRDVVDEPLHTNYGEPSVAQEAHQNLLKPPKTSS